MLQIGAAFAVVFWAIVSTKVMFAQTCSDDEFACHIGPCINLVRFCDGYKDCWDGSDEKYIPYGWSGDENITLCRRHERHLAAHCLDQFSEFTEILSCPLPNDLLARKDEICLGADSRKKYPFTCSDHSYCLSHEAVCDGFPDCRDGSDEDLHNSSVIYDEGVSFCRGPSERRHRRSLTFRSVKSVRICVVQALNSEFAKHHCSDNGCRTGEYSCLDGSQCISSSAFCDGVPDCNDGSDEKLMVRTVVNNKNATACRVAHADGDTAYNARMCALEGDNQAFHGNLCTGSSCRSDEFACKDGILCLEGGRFCDGLLNCRDGSDEIRNSSEVNFEVRKCSVLLSRRFETRSTAACLLHEGHICDGTGFCEENIDECLCDGKYFLDNNCFKCLTDHLHILPVSKLCDGKMDCADLSDECMCDWRIRPNFCGKLRWGTLPGSTRRQPYMYCASTVTANKTAILTARICDGITHCLSGEDEIGCHTIDLGSSLTNYSSSCTRTTSEGGALRSVTVEYNPCDGIPECPDYWEEECDCPKKAPFCEYLQCAARDGGNQIVYPYVMCDGKPFCVNLADERGCKSRFYCTSEPLPNIPVSQQCDRQEQCPNGSDEDNCKHFYCDDGGSLKYLPLHAVCDGIQDCMAGSDECQLGCIESAFSDEEAMIGNKAMLTFVWIISVAAIVGCVLVVAVTWHCLMKKRHKSRRRSNEQRELNNRLILSLSASDLLVGIFTFAICIKAAQFDHDYCRLDRSWRSSSTCAGLGAILVIGSQQSVFTMVLIASQRLHGVLRPFARPKVRQVTIALLITWIVSILFGVVPLLRNYEDYFVTSITFTANPILKTVFRNDTEHIITWLSEMHHNVAIGNDYGNTEWTRVKSLVAELNPNITVLYEFGYYASHTVCLPTFFPDRMIDHSWAYTAILLTINCVAFIFMLAAYIVLYRHAVKRKALNESSSLSQNMRKEQNAKMQRKLTRILATDFLCWMPICIMGFLQLGEIPIPKDVYLPAGLLIIPINSSLNPFLYSDLPDIILDKLKRLRGLGCPADQNQSQEQEVIEMEERRSM